jgi:hypothetical protein
MAEVNAVVGYLPDAAAKALASATHHREPIQVRMERGSEDMQVRINPNDVAGVLLGASSKGETSVQVFLNDKATVETVARGVASDLFLKTIKDLTFFPYRPPLVSIYANPVLIKQLVDAQKLERK